jgi:hypothetical protein
VIPDATDHEAKLRSVGFTVIGLVEANALGLATVGFVNHGHGRFSVRVRYVPATADYRTSWQIVESRPRQPDDDRSIDQSAQSALWQALKYEDATPRLLGEIPRYNPANYKVRRTRVRTAPVQHVTVTIDGQPAQATLVQDDASFGCQLLLPASVVTTFGRDSADRLEFRRIDRQELLSIPRCWDHPLGF